MITVFTWVSIWRSMSRGSINTGRYGQHGQMLCTQIQTTLESEILTRAYQGVPSGFPLDQLAPTAVAMLLTIRDDEEWPSDPKTFRQTHPALHPLMHDGSGNPCPCGRFEFLHHQGRCSISALIGDWCDCCATVNFSSRHCWRACAIMPCAGLPRQPSSG